MLSGTFLQNIKAVIFDFDGVILESASIKTQAFLELFADYPQHQAEILNYHLANTGVSRYDKFAWIYRELLKQPLTHDQSQCLGKIFSGMVMDKIMACPFVPGALETLQAVQGQCLMFIASGTPQQELETIVQRRNLSKYFAGIWGEPQKKTEIIDHVISLFNLDREKMLFVGDGISDYQAALTKGVPFIARNSPELHEKWVELEVHCITDLWDLHQRVCQVTYPNDI